MLSTAPMREPAREVGLVSDIQRLPEILTSGDVQIIVEAVLGPAAEIIACAVERYSDEKLGFLGSHQRLRVIARRSGSTTQKSINFFMKAIPHEVPTQAAYVREKGVFPKESSFFNELVPELEHSFQGEPWGPRCYLARDNVLVFEELTAKGFSMRAKLYDEELATAGLVALARLHAASLVAEDRLGKPLNQLYPHAFVENAFCREGMQYRWYRAGIDVAVAVAEELGLDPCLLPEACEGVFEANNPSRSTCNVISHGDAWSNNLMFDNSSPPRCRLVDFQLIRYSPPAHDVSLFLHLTTSRKLRETRGEAMLKSYHSMLRDTLENLQAVNSEVKPPSWSDMVRGMKEQRLGAVVTAVMFLPTVLLDGALGAKVMDDPKSYAEYVYKDRRNVVLPNMKRDIEYATRIKEAVTELHELASCMESLPKPS